MADPALDSARLALARLEGEALTRPLVEMFSSVAVNGAQTSAGDYYEQSNELEGRLILEHDFEDVRLALNPAVTKRLGTDSASKLQAELSTGIYYRRLYAVQPGLEMYSQFGAIGSPSALRQQQHVLFPTLTLRFANAFIWNVGVGFGLTSVSDKLTLKSILSHQFQTIRPSEQAR